MSGSEWARMELASEGGVYLGCLVGPQMDARANFQTTMEKFKTRAAFWLAQSSLGAFFHVVGFETFALSTP